MAKFFHATLEGFIDRDGVGKALDKKERRVLARAGGYARTTMKRGMRKKKGASAPGAYPNAHSGLLKQFIYFNYDQRSGTVAIGPKRFDVQPNWLPSGIETVPQLLNEGATVRRRVHGKLRRYVYEPRPFVKLTREAAAKNLVKIYKDTPLKR